MASTRNANTATDTDNPCDDDYSTLALPPSTRGYHPDFFPKVRVRTYQAIARDLKASGEKDVKETAHAVKSVLSYHADLENITSRYVAKALENLSLPDQKELLVHTSRIFQDSMSTEERVKVICALRSIPKQNREKFTDIVTSLFTPRGSDVNNREHDRAWLTTMLAESKKG